MKYFLTSLWQLASTLYEVEKARAEKLTIQFLNRSIANLEYVI